MSTSLKAWLPLAMTRWRQGRRKFDERLPNERRLMICAAVALVGFVLDAALITPSVKKFTTANSRNKTAILARDTLEGALQHRQQDMAMQEVEARREIERIKQNIERGKQALAAQQSMLAPAREMRALLESMLTQNGGLQLKAMRTLPPQEVKLSPVSGVAISQALLYRQSMEIAVTGSFIEALTWLRSIESMPRKLLWDGLELKSEEGKVTLMLKVHTFSPDRDALEIMP
jgi:MSHA biogenesis protein MshJ